MSDNDLEVDSSVMFKQEEGQLTTVFDLEDALNSFGYSKDDRISKRESVLIYSKIKDSMESEIFTLANTTAYAAAKEMRARLTNLRQEFDQLQLVGVETLRNEQVEFFRKDSSEIFIRKEK